MPPTVQGPDRDAAAPYAGCDDLLDQVACGDQRAFAELYDIIAARVLGTIRRLVIDPAQSEEVAQEVFLQVWQEAPGFDRRRASAVTWILTVARRRAIDRIRSAQASTDRDLRIGLRDLHPVADVAEAVEITVERERAQHAMAQLPDVQRQAITLAYDGGYTHGEIAELLKVPIGTVKTRLRDGMIRLRDLMGVTQ